MYSPETYKMRFVDKKIEEYMTIAKAIYISGPKWVGKTTSAERYCIEKNGSKVCFDDSENGYEVKSLAKIDPALVLEGPLPRLIDEWQECPAIWDKIRTNADNRTGLGLYALSGSFVDYDKYEHSGAGRIEDVKMDSMTLFETGDSSGSISLSNLFDLSKNNKKFAPISTGTVSLSDLIRYMVRGGWPGCMNLTADQASLLTKDYLSKVDKDVLELLNKRSKRNTEKMVATLEALAEFDNSYVLYSNILTAINNSLEVSITKNTLYDYLDAFEKLQIIVDQKPLIPKIEQSRNVFKSAKHRFTDSSLICAALNISRAALLEDSKLRVKLFDSLVFHDLRVYTETVNNGEIYHYADNYGLTIDNIIIDETKKLGAFMTVLDTSEKAMNLAAEKLLRFKTTYSGTAYEPVCMGIISGLSNAAYQREDGIFVVPLTALKP